jgi:hypothetical protein
LAAQYLTLQPMQPSQLLTMDQLAAALPPPVPFTTTAAPAATEPAPAADPTHGMPMAEAAPMVLPHTHPVVPQVALLQPTAPEPAAPEPAAPEPAAPQPVAPVVSAPLPAVSAQVPVAVPVPLPPGFAAPAPIPHFAPKPAHHGTHHAAPPAQPWLAQAGGYQSSQRRHADHHTAPLAAPAPRQFYAANVPPRETAPAPRITPQAATVMYSPALGVSSGSSLGMASSASLAPPRPLYSNSQ